MKKLSLKVLVAAALGLCTGTASAVSITTLLSSGGPQTLLDDSAERIIDTNGDGLFGVGDRMRGIFEITKVNGTSIGLGTSLPELTGIYDLTVITKTLTFLGGTSWEYTFGPSVAFEASFGAGVAIAMFVQLPGDYTAAGPVSIDEVHASNGARYLSLGFSAPDDFWRLTTPFDDLVAASGRLPAGTPIGSFDFGLHLITNFTGKILTSEPCPSVMVDACGSGTLTATGGTSPWDMFDPLQIVITTVPEPGTLTLMGIGLAAFGSAQRAARRRRNQW